MAIADVESAVRDVERAVAIVEAALNPRFQWVPWLAARRECVPPARKFLRAFSSVVDAARTFIDNGIPAHQTLLAAALSYNKLAVACMEDELSGATIDRLLVTTAPAADMSLEASHLAYEMLWATSRLHTAAQLLAGRSGGNFVTVAVAADRVRESWSRLATATVRQQRLLTEVPAPELP